MNSRPRGEIADLPELRGRTRVFRDRTDAGRTLAGMLEAFRDTRAIVLAIPAGGIPVAAAIASHLNLPLDVAVVSKVTLPWNTEAGYGAVAFDGTVLLNEALLPCLGLSQEDIRRGIEQTTTKVAKRVRAFRRERPFPDLAECTAILVDDGLASGFTMRVAVRATRKAGAQRVIIAVPTGHWEAVRGMVADVDAIYCANIRGGWSFAVADAYQHWSDVDESEAAEILREFEGGIERQLRDSSPFGFAQSLPLRQAQGKL